MLIFLKHRFVSSVCTLYMLVEKRETRNLNRQTDVSVSRGHRMIKGNYTSFSIVFNQTPSYEDMPVWLLRFIIVLLHKHVARQISYLRALSQFSTRSIISANFPAVISTKTEPGSSHDIKNNWFEFCIWHVKWISNF